MTRTNRAKFNAPLRGSAAATRAASSTAPDARSQLATIVEHSNDAIFSRTLDGVITTWNAAAERIFGFKAKEIVRRSSRLLLPPGQRDEFRKLLARIRKGEAVQHYDTERLRKDGERIHVSLTLSPVRDARRRLIGFSTIARDITGERRTIGLLARREHELQDLFDEASVGIILTARDGTVLRANRAFLELLNRKPEQVFGRTLAEFHPEPDAVSKMLAQLAERQTIHNVSTVLLTPGGTLRHVLADANALWERGRFVHSRWFMRDISRRKQLERELLELSERERHAFAQELHDGLGQQLGGVAYLSNVLREKLAERDAPEAGDAARIFDLVREAIEHTRRISRGLSPIRPEPDGLMIALRELAHHTTELFRVRCRLQCRNPVLVADTTLAGHLFRIAQEAVNNALKHGQPRGIHLRLNCARGNITLVVADDGKGIGPLSPTRQGLGLHIMQHRAGLIRGTVNVQARRGGGTEVICTAPCLEATMKRRKRRAPGRGL
jgi:PAS domain S-box-containing protein